MVKNSTPDHSLVKDIKRAWGNCLIGYFKFNVPQVTSCELTNDCNLVINGNEYKFDVQDYTGCAEKYVFFNPVSGRLVIESNGISKVYKFEVDFLE
jgi:hypothetical protein